eukprot:scaffold75893_cov16-Prasinocladus_malaysianus.AAC.1
MNDGREYKQTINGGGGCKIDAPTHLSEAHIRVDCVSFCADIRATYFRSDGLLSTSFTIVDLAKEWALLVSIPSHASQAGTNVVAIALSKGLAKPKRNLVFTRYPNLLMISKKEAAFTWSLTRELL